MTDIANAKLAMQVKARVLGKHSRIQQLEQSSLKRNQGTGGLQHPICLA